MTIHMYMCNGGIVRNLDVKAHGHNNDGIDLEMTRNFLVEDCTFDQKCQGMANKDLSKFADQINALCDKWDR